MPLLGSTATTLEVIGSTKMCGSIPLEKSKGIFFRMRALCAFTSTLYKSMDRLVTMKKLKSSSPAAKQKLCITFAFEKVSLTSSAEVSEKKSKVSTFSFTANARHFFEGWTAAAFSFGLFQVVIDVFYLLVCRKMYLDRFHSLAIG